jgi:hypothetical protein
MSHLYVQGMKNLACAADIDGANFDGLNYPRHTMARLRKVTESCRGNQTIFNMHGGDSFGKAATGRHLSTVVKYMAHYTFIDSLMDGEQFNYTEGADYYLLELSGLPFGIMNDLYGWTGGIGEPNVVYGALYGMNARLPNGPGLEVIESVWNVWDSFDIASADMYGYWDDECPVHVHGGQSDVGDVRATAFVQPGNATWIAIANFAKHPGKTRTNVTLTIEWSVLGLSANMTSLCAPQVVGVQTSLPQERPVGLWADGDVLSIGNGGGLWLMLTTRPIKTHMVAGRCTGQPPPQRHSLKTDDDLPPPPPPLPPWVPPPKFPMNPCPCGELCKPLRRVTNRTKAQFLGFFATRIYNGSGNAWLHWDWESMSTVAVWSTWNLPGANWGLLCKAHAEGVRVVAPFRGGNYHSDQLLNASARKVWITRQLVELTHFGLDGTNFDVEGQYNSTKKPALTSLICETQQMQKQYLPDATLTFDLDITPDNPTIIGGCECCPPVRLSVCLLTLLLCVIIAHRRLPSACEVPRSRGADGL